ncbi:MAG: electron transport complex subunit RsxA [Candidatus Margulisiibacteriota bacterium]|nr:MAG: electron transport complex subunit RsxA [Candidatus Margulisbacteria bacterium GWD2_39_127]OGI03837.1 MAG: electron transport complex subunit RsxA [Candidatus Margulisbacteria bacterium GWF2_38_17]OGI06396.1 MAG: electron transport complex subunit RsxA [Candidatus Margulisbacteria bacterium GWE2_39_32]PZM79421.1 MAG: electron transport complex subunit RsxA [Candidatus Margulisiibacteriota bacterium]HAR63527.1 electron transport complex subunit RsxA [Candidatus Margulisiibacteriota bacte
MLQQIMTAFLGAVLIENFVLVRFLGICPFLGVSRKTDTALGMGVAVVFVMAISSAVTWMVQEYILVTFHLEYLQTITFILVIATLVQLVELIIQKTSQALYKALGVYLPLITTNCAVLGVCIINVQKGSNFLDSFLYGTFAGMGFTLAIVLFAGIRERLVFSDIPENLKGFPISLISASLVSLAFFGFQGLIK